MLTIINAHWQKVQHWSDPQFAISEVLKRLHYAIISIMCGFIDSCHKPKPKLKLPSPKQSFSFMSFINLVHKKWLHDILALKNQQLKSTPYSAIGEFSRIKSIRHMKTWWINNFIVKIFCIVSQTYLCLEFYSHITGEISHKHTLDWFINGVIQIRQ